MKAAVAITVAVALNLLSASAIDDGVSLLAVVLQNRSRKVQQPSAEVPEVAGPILIPLTRLQGNATTGGTWRNSTYVGELFLGRPQLQRLLVTFDTASGQVILPSSRCRSAACRERSRYAPRASAHSREINADGSEVRVPAGAMTVRRDAITVGVTSIDHGAGRAYGDLVYDRVCFGGIARQAQCADLGFVGVTNMSDVPFRDMMQDGLVGLGLSQLAANPIFHVLSRLDLSGLSHSFGVFLGAKGGELSLGGPNPARLQGGKAPFNWAPVHQPEDGYWQFSIAGIRIGNHTLSACGQNCRGIIDTSAAGLGLPTALHASLEHVLGETSCGGPDLVFDVKAVNGPTFSLKLTSEDYRSHDCHPMLSATDLPEAFTDVLILGQPILRKYYTVFDWETRRLGFGPVAAVSTEGSWPTAMARTLKDEDGVELPVLTTQEAEALETEVLRREPRVDPHFMVTLGGMSMEAHALSVLLLQVLIMQVVVVFILVAFGGPRSSQESIRARLLFSPLGVALQCWFGVTLPQDSKLTSWLLAIRPVPSAEAPEASECVVCLGVREEDVKPGGSRPNWCKLRCGHCFHQDCISQWLPKVAQCPVCRSNIFDGKRPAVPCTPPRTEGAP